MKLRLLTLFAALVAAAVMGESRASASPPLPVTFTDPLGDASGGAPDIAQIVVSNDVPGTLRFVVIAPNEPVLQPSHQIGLNFDTDQNSGTGNFGTERSVFINGLAAGQTELGACRWVEGSGLNCGTPAPFFQPSLVGGYADGRFTFSISTADLGVTGAPFNVSVYSTALSGCCSILGTDGAATFAYSGYEVAGLPPVTLSSDTTLTADMTFECGGFIVTTDNITLNLNGFTITTASATPAACIGVSLTGSSGVTIENGSIRGFGRGIAVSGGSGNLIRGATIEHSTANGITLSSSSNNVIRDSRVQDNPSTFAAISLFQATGNTLENNLVLRNGVGTQGTGIGIFSSSGNMARGNTVSGNSGHGVQLALSGGGLPSNDNIIQDNQIINNARVGVSINSSSNNLVLGNLIEGQGDADPGSHGIGLFQGSSNNTASGNVIAGNSGHGIQASSGSPGNTIRDNQVRGNTRVGITINGSINNSVIANRTEANLSGIFIGAGSNGNVVAANTAVGNSSYGIHVAALAAGSVEPENNTVTGNLAYGNGTGPEAPFDIRDATTGAGTAGTRNIYSANDCVLGSPVALCLLQPATLMAVLGDLVEQGYVSPTTANGLLAKLTDAQNALDRGNTTVAVNKLNDFISQVKAQSGKGIQAGAASLLIQQANYVVASLS